MIQQFKNVVNNLVLDVSEQDGLRKDGLRDSSAGISTGKFGNDVVKILLRAEALLFEHYHSAELPHIRDGRFFHDQGVALATRVRH